MRLADLPDDDTLLATYAEPAGDGEYRLIGAGVTPFPQATVLSAIKAAVLLDQTPQMTVSAAWAEEVATRLVLLEDEVTTIFATSAESTASA